MRRSWHGVMRTIGSSPFRARTGASRVWRTAAALTGATAVLALLLPGGVSSAQSRNPAPDLNSLVAQAKQLQYQINALSEQYDGLRVQLSSARVAASKAQKAALQDSTALKASRSAVSRLASASYMNAGYDPILELFTSSNPEQFLGQASITQQLDRENGDRVTGLKAAEAADARARETARQQIARVTALQTAMSAKSQAIQSEIDKINSSAMQQAMAIFQQTGQYPNIDIPGGNSVGAVALRAALSRRGDPYVWGAAGPSAFDCSGLVMWAYAQEGISLPHYTGSQWNMGEHISRSQLQPGDLLFFFADISHVGLYIGNGLMVAAPTFGQTVQVQPVPWEVYVGAVRIQA